MEWAKKHKILTVILIIVVIAIAGSALSGGSDTANQTAGGSSSNQDSDSGQATVAKIGQPARDGKFEFTVKGVKCGQQSVGDQFAKVEAQGQFCRVSLKVKNIGDEAQTLDYSSQYLYNAQGQKYSADDEAAIYADVDNSSQGAWYNDVNPGNTVNGDLFFDVPKSVKPAKIELHDSAFSDGIEVKLN